jgi:hypothetical protein
MECYEGYHPVNSVALVRLARLNARQSGPVADAAAHPKGQARKYVTNEVGSRLCAQFNSLFLSVSASAQHQMLALYVQKKPLRQKPACAIAQV